MEYLNKYCRCCGLQETDFINIFENKIDSIENELNISLADAIKDLTYEMVEPNDGLPILICQLCKCKLSNAYCMKYKIKHTAMHFNTLIKSNKSHQLLITNNNNNDHNPNGGGNEISAAAADNNNNSIIATKSGDNAIKPIIIVSINNLPCDKNQQLEEDITMDPDHRDEKVIEKVKSKKLDCDIKYKGFKKHILNEATEQQNHQKEQLIINNNNNNNTAANVSENLNDNNNNNNNHKQMLTRGMLEKRKALAIQIKTKKIKPTTEYMTIIPEKLFTTTTTTTMAGLPAAPVKLESTSPPQTPSPPTPVLSKNTKDIAMLTDKLIKSLSSNDDSSLKIQITNRGSGGGGVGGSIDGIVKWPTRQNVKDFWFKSKPTDNIMLKMEKSIDNNLSDAVSFVSDENFQKFIQSEELKKIAAYEKRRHPCAICHKRFVGKSNLVDHLRFHANVRPFQCNYCERTFIQISSLKSHERVHTKERPYHCNICEKMFSQSSALKMHIRTHTNERKYKCTICDKAFVSQGDLGKHKRIHESIKPFYCDLCKKGFAQKCNLKKHLHIIHTSDDS